MDTARKWGRSPGETVSVRYSLPSSMRAAGGQSIVNFDYAMAEGVRYTYTKHMNDAIEMEKELGKVHAPAWCKEYALKKTRRDTYQAMEGLIHNLNTMQSRAGAQVE